MTHQTNLLDPSKQDTANQTLAKIFLPNIHRTIELYKSAWDDSKDEMKIWFLDNADCQRVLHRLHPDLAYYFQRETIGMFQADLCRAAALYLTGGYYLDLDLFPVPPARNLAVADDVEFCTAIMLEGPAAGLAYLNAFWAAAPKNPIVLHSLWILLSMYYHRDGRTQDIVAWKQRHQLGDDSAIDTALDLMQEFKGALRGPIAAKAAYDAHVQTVSTEQQVNALFLVEELMHDKTRRQALRDDAHFYFQDHKNHEYGPGQGCCCDYLVHNGTQAMFFSRFVGSGWRCQRKSPITASNASAADHSNDLSFWQQKNRNLPLFNMDRALDFPT